MGAWGPAIFSNDTSADVRDEFKDLIAEGLDEVEATARLIEANGETANDPDDEADFWLGLALTQHQLGRLLPDVQRRAFEIIDTGRDLQRWNGSDKTKRRAVLAKARAKLASPQPKPKRPKRQVQTTTSLECGQHVLYRLDAGQRILLRVVNIHSDRGGRAPVVVVLQWTDGEPVPTGRDLRRCPPYPDRHGAKHSRTGKPFTFGFVLFGSPGDPIDRLEVLPDRAKRRAIVAERSMTGGIGWWWSKLDEFFTEGRPTHEVDRT